MLDRVKVMREFAGVSGSLFLDLSAEHQQAWQSFQACAADEQFLDKVRAQSAQGLPFWIGNLLDTHSISPYLNPYQIVSVDGSQIYPDKHQGTCCFLINIGTVIFRYGKGQGSSSFSAEPFLFLENESDDQEAPSVDLVNGKREELEFLHGLSASLDAQEKNPELPLLFLFDGSLIFWHLESKEPKLRDLFLYKYCALLQKFYEAAIPLMGYISLPKSKDLIHLIRSHITNFSVKPTDRTAIIQHTVDSTIASFFLDEGCVTTLFQNNSPITELYPKHLRPWFCYYSTPQELVRLEFPQYVAHNKTLFLQSLQIVADQVLKGNGYPISTAEAHVQAVVRGPDREFFYHVLERHSIEQKKRIIVSQKSLKKRKMSL